MLRRFHQRRLFQVWRGDRVTLLAPNSARVVAKGTLTKWHPRYVVIDGVKYERLPHSLLINDTIALHHALLRERAVIRPTVSV